MTGQESKRHDYAKKYFHIFLPSCMLTANPPQQQESDMSQANFRFVPVRDAKTGTQTVAVLVSGDRVILATAFGSAREDAVAVCELLNRRLGLEPRAAA